MIKLFILFVLLGMTCSSIAQQNCVSEYVNIDTILNFQTEHTSSQSVPAYVAWKDMFVFTNFSTNNPSDTIVVYGVNANSLKVDTIRLFEQGIRRKMSKKRYSQFENIACNDNLLVLAYGTELLIYTKREDGSYYRSNTIKYKQQYRSICFTDSNTLLLSDNYYCQEHQTDLTLLDIRSGRVKNRIAPPLNSPLMSLIGIRPLIVNMAGGFIWCNSSEYSFAEYDDGLKRKDSIFCKTNSWNTLPIDVMTEISLLGRYNPIGVIDLLNEHWKELSIIIGAYPLNSNHFMVLRKASLGECRYGLVDVWSKDDGSWKRSMEDVVDKGWLPKEGELITKHNIPLNFLAGDKTCVADNKIVALTTHGCVDNPIGLTSEEYQRRRYEYLVEHDNYIQVRVYSHSFCNK